jgi:hypothetical protein
LNSSIDKGISEIVGIFSDPILVFPGGWGDTLPEWLKGAITMERLIENMKSLKGGEMTGTDAEACAYLMTVSLTQPMDGDWSQIYLYVSGKTCKRWGKSELPSDIAVDSISENQLIELNRLKAWLYRERTKIRLERERAERRENKMQEKAKRRAERPVLFEF